MPVKQWKDHRGDHHVTVEADTGIIQLQASGQRLPATAEAQRRVWNRFRPRPFGENVPTDTVVSDFQPPEPKKSKFLLF